MNDIEYFSENPNLDFRVVETFDSKKEYLINCRKIGDEYFVKGKDIQFVEGKWYRVDLGSIFYDYETRTWVKETMKQKYHYIFGMVDFKNNEIVKGWFRANHLNNCTIISNGGLNKIIAINPNLLYDNGFVEDVSRGMFWKRSDLTASAIREISKPVNKVNHQNKGYNLEDNVDEFVEKTQIFNTYNMPMSKEVRRFGKFLGDTTYGCELETIKGYLPAFQQYRTGTVICRDGSLHSAGVEGQGAEFVTVPMSGAKGLQNIVNLCTELSKRTEIDINCSLHIHLGNLPTSRLFLVALYMLCFKIQNEVFQMFPYYKTDPSGVKEKNYNQKLRKLGMFALNDYTKAGYDEFVNSAYYRLFTFLSGGAQPNKKFNRKTKLHPAGNQKWNKLSRYFWVNFINSVFSERNTIEFRLHHGTLNAQKVINWLFIINAIVKYASLNEKTIITTGKKISLSKILNFYADFYKTDRARFLSDYLNAYVEERKKIFKSDYQRGDIISQHEISKDLEYTFKFGGVSALF